jgi:hypothetical protein
MARHLRQRAGNAVWFPQFSLTACQYPHTLFLLLWEMFRNHIRCFITGSINYFSAGVSRNLKGATMYVSITDTPLNTLIFQMGDDIVPVFQVGRFAFPYLRSLIEEGIYIYEVTKGKTSVFSLS